MKVTLRWTDAMRRLMRHITETIEDEGTVSYGDMHWLETLINFRRVDGKPRLGRMGQVAEMFDNSGLAGVLLGEEHFPALEKRKIKSIRLVDASARGVFPNELVMGVPSYPKNWRH